MNDDDVVVDFDIFARDFTLCVHVYKIGKTSIIFQQQQQQQLKQK